MAEAAGLFELLGGVGGAHPVRFMLYIRPPRYSAVRLAVGLITDKGLYQADVIC